MSTERRIQAIVSGRVQGVGFRFFVQRTAVAMHLKGYVRNQADRTVLFEAQGPETELREFIRAIEGGAGLARVEKIKLEWLEPRQDWVDFQISY